MPTYDYRCDKCGSTIEVTRSFDEESSATCSPCQSTMSRVWSAIPAHFKGGGWGGQ